MTRATRSFAGGARIDYMPAVALAIVVLLTGSLWVPSLLRKVWPAVVDRIAAWPEPGRMMAFGAAALVLVAALLASVNAMSLWLHRRQRSPPSGPKSRRLW